MKRPFYIWLALVSSVLIAAFLVWAFAQHGTDGFIHVNGTYKMAVAALLVTAAVTPVVAIVARSVGAGGRKALGRVLAVAVIALSFPGLIGMPAAFVVLGGLAEPSIGDTPPQLVITGRAGAHGIPDLAVIFNTAGTVQSSLVWGKVLGQDDGEVVREKKSSRTHAFLLRDLEPDTAYYYNIDRRGTLVFHTPPVGDSLHFAVEADVHFGSSAQDDGLTEQGLAQIANPENGYDYFFLAGDTVNWGFSKSQWREALETLSRATSIIPSRLVAGNHDTMFSGFGNYLRYAYPEGLPVGSGSRLWSRIDTGSVHFLVIDLEWSAEAFTDEQAAWLEAELDSIPDDEWKIVIGHGFTYASGGNFEGWPWYDNPETIGRLVPLFEKYGVDLVFSGHNHQMEVLEKAGVSYVLCSPLAREPDPERTHTSPYSLWYSVDYPGFADVTVSGNEASVVFRNPEGREIYSCNFSQK
jgi:hypothetical protein